MNSNFEWPTFVSQKIEQFHAGNWKNATVGIKVKRLAGISVGSVGKSGAA
jgi:hypothetical protein